MKKLLTILAVAMVVAGAAQATIIYSNNFSSGITYTNSIYGARIGDETTETSYNRWYTATTAGITNGVLQVPGASSSANSATTPRSGVIVLSSTNFSGAGELKLSWDYILWNNVNTDVQVWNAQSFTGNNTNWYLAKYTDSAMTSNQVSLNGTATKEFLAGYSFDNTSGAAVTNVNNSITFNYDGTGDIVLMFGAVSATSWYAVTTKFDNVVLEAIPEPATIGMLGLGALVTLLVRRMRAS